MVKEKLVHLETSSTQRNVAKLSILLSPRAERTPGIASYITELFYRNCINIVDAFLGHSDIIMIVDGNDGHVAYEALQKEIHSGLRYGSLSSSLPKNGCANNNRPGDAC